MSRSTAVESWRSRQRAWPIRWKRMCGLLSWLRRRGEEPERWHWVYTGACFRLDHRGKTAGGRPIISERGFVATREGIDGLREQLHAEALRQYWSRRGDEALLCLETFWRNGRCHLLLPHHRRWDAFKN